MSRVFVSRRLPGPALGRLEEAHEVEVWQERLPPSYEDLRAQAATADGLLTLLTDRVDAALIEAAPQLRAISNYAVGVDNIDLAAATSRKIPIGHTPDVLTEATADLTFALLLAAARRVPEATEAARTGDWLTWEPGMHLGADVHGATLGIIGMGRIGRAIAHRAQGFEMKIIGAGRGAARGSGTTYAELLERSDFVSIHCPLTPETHHLINARTINLMKPSAILINTARGGIVDQVALADALERGTIAGAALDVTDPEPLPLDDPLWQAPNLIVAPHIGSATTTAREKMADLAVTNLLAGLDGKPMPHQANLTA